MRLAFVLIALVWTSGYAYSKGCHEKKVVMLSADWCSFCAEAKKWFSEKDIALDVIDIASNRGQALIIEFNRVHNYKSLPIFFTHKGTAIEYATGFNQKNFKESFCE